MEILKITGTKPRNLSAAVATNRCLDFEASPLNTYSLNLQKRIDSADPPMLRHAFDRSCSDLANPIAMQTWEAGIAPIDEALSQYLQQHLDQVDASTNKF